MPLTRRTFLAGTAGAAFLAACGGDDGGGEDEGNDAAVADDTINLLAVFPPENVLVTGGEQRFTFTLADFEGAPLTRVPRSLDFTILDAAGEPLAPPQAVRRRGAGLPVPYFPVTAEFAEAGTYQATTTVDGQALEPRVFVVSDPADVRVVQPGSPMPPIDTPTTADARGVDPICTREPACPLHDVTLREALTEGRPVAFLIATPEFCQTEMCGPVLDVLLSQRDAFPDVHMVHAEVYSNPRGVDNITDPANPPTEAVTSYLAGLFEPSLFLARGDGTVAARLDNIFDETELAERLTRLSG